MGILSDSLIVGWQRDTVILDMRGSARRRYAAEDKSSNKCVGHLPPAQTSVVDLSPLTTHKPTDTDTDIDKRMHECMHECIHRRMHRRMHNRLHKQTDKRVH